MDKALVIRNWLFGWYIVEYEQNGEDRAEYGRLILSKLSEKLYEFGLQGVSVTNLKLCRIFYERYPKIGQTLSDQLALLDGNEIAGNKNYRIGQTLFDQLSGSFNLSWSHYVFLTKIDSREERAFYEVEALNENWSLRELERQFNTGLYERLLLSNKDASPAKLAALGHRVQKPGDLIKNPYILEFLGMAEKSQYSEKELETAILDKIENFLLELGKGFLFHSRQKRFTFDEDHFYVDLVFYNRLLKCFVLVDLKIGKLTHQDLGQMQMYVNYYDRFEKTPDENKTIGIILCKQKNDSLVEITLPDDNNQIYASKYQLYLPSKEEFKRQIQEAQLLVSKQKIPASGRIKE